MNKKAIYIFIFDTISNKDLYLNLPHPIMLNSPKTEIVMNSGNYKYIYKKYGYQEISIHKSSKLQHHFTYLEE